jgi:NADH dehydrogenase
LVKPPKNVLILGGGFAGVAVGKVLAGQPHLKTTLISHSRNHLYHASLYEAACEEVTRETVTIPLKDIFGESAVQVVLGEVAKIDKGKSMVYLASGGHYSYDYLVLALGAESADFGIKGVKEHALMFREITETMLIRENLRTACTLIKERGGTEIEVVICGGGFSGVELAAEMRHHLGKMAQDAKITILEAGTQILSGMPEKVVKLVLEKLGRLGIEILLGDPVAEVKKDGVRLKSGGWVASDVTIWTVGTKPNFLPADAGLPLDEKGRPVVNEFLAVSGYPEIFAAGDLAGFTDPRTGRGIPPQASNAIKMGRLVGENILRSTRRIPLKAFRPGKTDFIIPVGHNDAVALIKGKVLAGLWPSILRKLIEFNYLNSLFGPIKAWPIFWEEVKVIAD